MFSPLNGLSHLNFYTATLYRYFHRRHFRRNGKSISKSMYAYYASNKSFRVSYIKTTKKLYINPTTRSCGLPQNATYIQSNLSPHSLSVNPTQLWSRSFLTSRSATNKKSCFTLLQKGSGWHSKRFMYGGCNRYCTISMFEVTI